MRTAGIDLAADPANTAASVVDWADGRAKVSVIPAPVYDDTILAFADEVDRVGIDAPFGWPDEFVEAVAAFHRGLPWPGRAEADQPAFRRRLRFRLTDLVVSRRLGRTPLSVSSDLIAVPAMRCAYLLDRLSEEWGSPVDRVGRGRVVETYPAAALAEWGLTHRGYKGARNRETLAGLADALLASAPWLDLDDKGNELIHTVDDAFDALLCALIARAAALRCSGLPSPEDGDQAAREGWIHVPDVPLDQLA